MVSEMMVHMLNVKTVMVLILIVLEDGLWDTTLRLRTKEKYQGLNPYCVGRWSLRIKVTVKAVNVIDVLILIVLEDGLWVDSKLEIERQFIAS